MQNNVTTVIQLPEYYIPSYLSIYLFQYTNCLVSLAVYV